MEPTPEASTLASSLSLPEPTLPKGKRFKDSKSALYAVQDYALYHNKQAKVTRRGGKHRRMVCSSTKPCPFFVQLYLHNSKTDNTWYVSSSDLTHSSECTSTAKPTQRQLVESPTFQRALAAKPNGTAAQLLKQLKGRTNLRTIYRAKQTMKQERLNQVNDSFKQLPMLLQRFVELNPGSCTKYQLTEPHTKAPGAFSRAFLSCNVFTQSTTFNQQIYGVAVVPCSNKEAKYQGVQMFLLGKDGNMGNVTVAVACCDAPSSENYRWFFRCVEESGVNLRYCPVLCAIDPELMTVERDLGLTFRYCTRYIIEHELAQIGSFNRHHHALVWGLQGSATEMEYTNRLAWIGTTCGPGVENYLRQLPMERWVVAGNIGKVAMYGWRSRTFFETSEQEHQTVAGEGSGLGVDGQGLGGNDDLGSNNVAATIASTAGIKSAHVNGPEGTEYPKSTAHGIDRYRNMLPFTFFEAVMMSFMEDAFERNTLAGKWKQNNRKVTQGAQDLYDAQYKRIGEYKVSRASETVAFVTKMNKDTNLRRRIDLLTSTCSCDFIEQYAIPCRHFIAVLLFCEQMDSVIDRFAPGYLVDNYVMAFRGKTVELPLGSALSADPTSETGGDATKGPNAPRRGTKRPSPEQDTVSTTRIETQLVSTEPGAVPQRIRLCKKCRGPGHNSRSCPMGGQTEHQ